MIDLGDMQMQLSESVHSLGVVIDNTLSFYVHVTSVCKAAELSRQGTTSYTEKLPLMSLYRHSDNDGGSSIGLM